MRLDELARETGARLEGDPELQITGVAGLDIAGPGQATFLSNPRYTPQVRGNARLRHLSCGESAS
ncbi:MAG: LpxD N-terminal domain-containing protein [Pyrinomonadaceae bacterium]